MDRESILHSFSIEASSKQELDTIAIYMKSRNYVHTEVTEIDSLRLMMMREDALVSDGLSTLLHHTQLLGHVTEPADDLFISIVESKDCIWDAGFFAECQDILLSLAKVVAWHAWVKVMDRLELQTTVEEVEPGGTVDIHGSAEHFLGKGLINSQVGS